MLGAWQGMQEGLEKLINHWGHRKYGGRLVYQTSDEWGEIEVVERNKELSLHFGRPEKQSSILLGDPNNLILDYTKAMVAGFSLIEDSPKKILCIGLGGGSLPRFLWHQFPEAQIDVVELRAEVAEVATEFFELPSDPRLQVYIADCKDYLLKCRSKTYDLIFVDAFSKEGVADSVQGFPFFRRLSAILEPQGVVVFNYWTEPQSLYQVNHFYLSSTFGNRLMTLDIPERTNRILFALGTDLQVSSDGQRADLAHQWERQFHIKLPSWAALIQPA